MDAQTRAIEDDDAAFVRRCRKGDVDAFESLVEKHQKRMLNVAYRIMGDYDDACDVVQEAFLSAFRAIGKFRGEARFSTWLYGIVLNHARNRLKQRESHFLREGLSIDDPAEWKEQDSPEARSFQGGSIHERLERRELEAKVQEGIRCLDGEQREVLVLRDIQGFSYEEIGEMLKLPDGTVKSRLFRARNALKDHLIRILGDLI